MKRVLLAVTGNHPQVVTETLYGLLKSGGPMPESVTIITTRTGKARAVESLINQGALARFVADYDLAPIKLDSDDILVMGNENHSVEHGDTSVDQAVIGDFIMDTVARLTQVADTAIHASIAGGRKSMSFYLGYALSLFGREQDTLSHVFVEPPFKGVDTFFYPTPKACWLESQEGELINAMDAKVDLAPIPFLRLRRTIPEEMLFEVVENGLEPQSKQIEQFDQTLSLTINSSELSLTIAGAQVKLTPKYFAFYLWLIHRELQGMASLKIDRDFEDDKEIARDYLDTAFAVVRDPRFYETFGVEREDVAENAWETLRGMDRKYVEQCRSNLKRKLKEALPNELAERLAVKAGKVDKVHSCWLQLAANDIDVRWVA